VRFDNGVTAKELQLERNLNKTAVDRKDSELTALSMALQKTIDENSILKSELRKIGGGIDKNAIATLQTELDKIKGELKERDVAIAKLKSELESQGEVKQLSFFPEPEPTKIPEPMPNPSPEPTQTKTQTPEPETENINSPAVESEPVNTEPDTTGTLTRGELVKYIHANFPGATITGQNIGDCYTLNKKGKLKSPRLPEFEATYGFKYLGKIGKENRFKLV
jgi:hypothetical protein